MVVSLLSVEEEVVVVDDGKADDDEEDGSATLLPLPTPAAAAAASSHSDSNSLSSCRVNSSVGMVMEYKSSMVDDDGRDDNAFGCFWTMKKEKMKWKWKWKMTIFNFDFGFYFFVAVWCFGCFFSLWSFSALFIAMRRMIDFDPVPIVKYFLCGGKMRERRKTHYLNFGAPTSFLLSRI